MRGFGFRFGFRTPEGEGGFSFSDADADVYYTALETANGGDIDAMAIYGITLTALKQAIDDLYITLKSDGSWSQMLYQFWFVGATDVTHAINGLDGASTLIYTGSPTHDNTGLVLNGTTQHASIGNDPSVDYITTSNHLLMFGTPTTTSYALGSRLTSGVGLYFRQSGTTREFVSLNTTGGRVSLTISTNNDKVHIASRISAIRSDIYNDGSSIAFITTSGGGLPSITQYIGAWNNNGSVANRMTGNLKAATLGGGLTSSQASNVTTAIKDFNLSLGR